MMKFLLSLITICALTANASVAAQVSSRLEPSKAAWKHADKLLKKMTVEEKVGQLIHIGINAKFANQDSEYFQAIKRDVVDNKVGGIIIFGAPMYETVHLVNRMQDNAKVPLLISIDAETGIGMRFGDATNFPWNMAVAATGDPEYARKIGAVTGREAKAMGIQHVFAPVLDVNNNADNPVINVRSYGEDPETVGRFGVAFIEGLQGQGVLATAKHFPGHGDTNVDSHRGLPIIDHSRESLEKTELVPFRRAIAAGVGSIMIAHIGLPQIDPTEIKPLKQPLRVEAEDGAEIVDLKTTLPATLSPIVQTQILRKEMNFQGLIVTDAMGMSGLTLYFDQKEAGVSAFLAGADILEKPADTEAMLNGLIEAVRSGRITEARLNESVRKILAWKYQLGLAKQKITPLDQIDRIVSGPDVEALANEIAAKAITLVRNDGGVLPLNGNQKIAILGISNGFDGTSTMASLVSTLRTSGLRFTSSYLQENSTADQNNAAQKAVNEADIVIVGLYGRVRSGAKNSVGIPENGAIILRDLLKAGKTVIGISFGNPYILSSFPELKTYIVAYGDMSSLQRASAQSLLGNQRITGRLPISLPGLYPRGTGIQFDPVPDIRPEK
ncbi:MAG: glycoside hydrolase family 3 C-terminal domain-containing protein [Chloracidobacterium sp.]|nr:glycoside hydrolase family 3 C-terminal domain-containing protein [Chloracidobacterium sp.]